MSRDRAPLDLVRAWAEQRFPGRDWPWTAARVGVTARSGRPRPVALTTRVAAAASGGLLALGIAIGMASGPGPDTSQAAGDPIVVVGPPPVAIAAAPVPPVTPAVARPLAAETPAPVAVTPPVTVPPPATPAPAPVPADPAPPAQEDDESDADVPADDEPATADEATPPRPKLPAVGHVVVVWMADGRSERTFAADSPLPFVAGTLAAQGLTLPRYHGVAHGTLANGIALLGGIESTPQQRADCPIPTPVAADDGCVLPADVPTLLGQLTGAGRSWKVYAGDLAATGADSCRAPAHGAPDPAALTPRPGDAFASARVPALWFASITSSPDCGSVVDLGQLERDLAAPDQLPDFSLVVPNVCDAGADVVCPDGRPSGPAAANAFLEGLVPKLIGTEAHAENGLVAVVWDQAPATGPAADARACCSTRPGFPAGGGRTGAVLLSPFVAPGTVLTKAYDHIALLRSLEDLFGLERLGQAAGTGVQGFGPKVFARNLGDSPDARVASADYDAGYSRIRQERAIRTASPGVSSQLVNLTRRNNPRNRRALRQDGA